MKLKLDFNDSKNWVGSSCSGKVSMLSHAVASVELKHRLRTTLMNLCFENRIIPISFYLVAETNR